MRKKAKQLKLALGEGSNTHILNSTQEIEFEHVTETTIAFWLKEQGILTHEEHAKIVLPPGRYIKYAQQEFDPFIKSFRAVFD